MGMVSPINLPPLTIAEQCDAWVAERSLLEFTQDGWRYVEPSQFQLNWHIEAICDHLMAIARGELRRAIFNIPPRHMKSLGSCVFFPAWTWMQDPDSGKTGHGFAVKPGTLMGPGVKFMYLTYDQGLSTRDSVKTRQLIESDWYQRRWGHRFMLRPDQNTKTRFDNMHGGHRIATSNNGMTTGEGGDVVVWDDPHNIKQIESPQILKETLRIWDEVLPTRLNDPKTGVFLVIMQRSSPSDITGHILARETGWTHLCLPAEYEAKHPFPFVTKVKRSSGPDACKVWTDPRTEGEPLWKERFPEDVLAEWSTRLGSHASAGQLGQRPTAREGGLFKRQWFEIVNAAPAACAFHRVRAWDLASSTDVTSDPDYTAGVRMGRDPSTGIFYVDDVVRERWSPGKLETEIVRIAQADGYQTKIRIPQDPGQAGKFQVRVLVSKLAGFVIIAEAESTSKESRADPFAAQCEAGNVKLVRGPWNEAFIDEHCAFSGAAGGHDDQVDGSSSAFRALVSAPNVPLQGSYSAR
jgi:predicted phage terminase large subunit-like protein